MEGPNGMKERLGLPELHHLGPLIAIACIALGGLSLPWRSCSETSTKRSNPIRT